ncbi:MAG: hypothetical protein GF353_07360 [Candidatus Lokiarchaeota archaeon]|nr:hypothetical protein [Candidatus Lokiarchaeota archaeon]
MLKSTIFGTLLLYEHGIYGYGLLRKPPPILHGCSLSAIIHPCNIVYAGTLAEIYF